MPPRLDQASYRGALAKPYPGTSPYGVKDFLESPFAMRRHRHQTSLPSAPSGDNDLFASGCPLNQVREFLFGLKNPYCHFVKPPGWMTGS
jgi:hypothetical protein